MESEIFLEYDNAIIQPFSSKNYKQGGVSRVDVNIIDRTTSEERLLRFARAQKACVLKIGTDYVVFRHDCEATALIKRSEYG